MAFDGIRTLILLLLVANFNSAREDKKRKAAKNMSELAAKLAHRNAVNDGVADKKMRAVSNVYMEFQEFTRKQINDYEKIFTT